ncbi:hypothetical protein [Dietzia sp. 179-F 9C3 NHS]|uniref:hypothetical protein n=1 Tax=Dietzia sp. 179-F 9C3 NHS TaxID=3374295 RepID=UPI003879ADE3
MNNPTVWIAQLQDRDDYIRELDWIMLATSFEDGERQLNERAATELADRYGEQALESPTEMIPLSGDDGLDPATATPLQLWCSAAGAKYVITELPLPTAN